MIETDNIDGIISSFMEINSEIITHQLMSKYPKFISKFIANNQRKNLLKKVKKIKSANIPLKRDNILELIYYIHNNYQPNGRFDKVQWTKIIKTHDEEFIEALIVDETIQYELKFNITTGKEKDFQLIIKDLNNNYDIRLSRLLIDNNTNITLRNIVYKFNILLYNIISNYIEESISSYNIIKESEE